ncbi:MAG TPA: hypothetical protein VMU77_00415 [Acidimicrobiales bacterium]|nr:hypothetical protein [Acidimicrobiales bacterium]
MKKAFLVCTNCGNAQVAEHDILEENENPGGRPCSKCGKSAWEVVPVEADS